MVRYECTSDRHEWQEEKKTRNEQRMVSVILSLPKNRTNTQILFLLDMEA